jgi:hypothetical protein
MANCASHFVDRVVPDVPVRQYVLSLPYEVRRLAAFKQDVLGAFVRIFIEAVSARYRTRAKLAGAQIGAITFLQRFGGSLNLNLHLHVVFLDGLRVMGRGAFNFTRPRHPTPPSCGRSRAGCTSAPRRGCDGTATWTNDPSRRTPTRHPSKARSTRAPRSRCSAARSRSSRPQTTRTTTTERTASPPACASPPSTKASTFTRGCTSPRGTTPGASAFFDYADICISAFMRSSRLCGALSRSVSAFTPSRACWSA